MGVLEKLEKKIEEKVQERMVPVVEKLDIMISILKDIRENTRKGE